MKISIRTLLTIPLLVLTLSPVVLVGSLFYLNSQRAINESVDALFAQTSSRMKSQIKLYLTTPHFINQLNANAIAQGLLSVEELTENPSELEKLETYFYEQVQAAAAANQLSDDSESSNTRQVQDEFEGSINHIYIGTEEGFFRQGKRILIWDSLRNRCFSDQQP